MAKGNPPKIQRNREVIRRVEAGDRYDDIARDYNISKGRVAQIVADYSSLELYTAQQVA